MTTYTLSIEASGIYISDVPTLEIWEDSTLDSSNSIFSTTTSLNYTIGYSSPLPSTLAFKFNDVYPETGRSIEIHSVVINGRHINIGNFPSIDSLGNGTTATVDVSAAAFLFGSDTPSSSLFSPTTFTMSNSDEAVRQYDGSDYILNGLDGRDNFYLGAGDDKITGGSDKDIIKGGDGNDLLYGDTGDDRLYGEGDDDLLYGGDGNDRIYGGDGNDELHGGNGNDNLNGQGGNDIITGGNGDDKAHGSAGNDYIYGDAGADQLVGGDGADTIDGGSGTDLVYGGNDDDIINGGDDADNLFGDNGDDIIFGDNGADNLYGRNDNDTLYGGNDADFLYGEDGADTLYCDSGDDTLSGGDGDDTLYGGSGNDTLIGSNGSDHLYGNSGADTFKFEEDTAFNGSDTIYNFNIIGGDKIDLSDLLDAYTGSIFDPITNYVRILNTGSDSVIHVDQTGSGTFNAGNEVAHVDNLLGLLDEVLLELTGTLITL